MDNVRRWRFFRAPISLMIAGDFTLALVLAVRAALDWREDNRPALEGLWAAPLMIRGSLMAVAAPGQWRRLAAWVGMLISLGFGAAVLATDVVGPLKVLPATYFSAIPFFVLGLLALDETRAGVLVRRMAPWAASAARIGAAVLFLTFLSGGLAAGQPGGPISARFHAGWVAGWMVWTASAVLTASFIAWWGCHLEAGRPARSLWLIALLGTLLETVGFTLIAMNDGDPALLYFGVAVAFAMGHVVVNLSCALMAGITPGMPRWLGQWSLGVCFMGFATAFAAWITEIPTFQVVTLMEAIVLFPWFVVVSRLHTGRTVV